MTGLFVGISDTVLCLIYNLIFRDSGGYFPTILISVSSLIFGINILFLCIGVIYYAFLKMRPKGELLFSIIFVILTVVGILASLHARRTDDPYMNARFRTLLTGIVLILGVSAACIPLIYHSKGFRKHIV